MLNIKEFLTSFCAIILFFSTEMVSATTLTFDDLNASGGDINLTGTGYQGYDFTNFFAYTSFFGFDGFSNGIVSPNNAAYSGGEIFDPTGAIVGISGTISSSGLFDFNSAYFNAAYYDNLDITVAGLQNGAVLFSTTITVNTQGAQLFNFGYTGINELLFHASPGTNFSDPFNCGTYNCTQFTVDNLNLQPSAVANVSEASRMDLLLLALLLFGCFQHLLSKTRLQMLAQVALVVNCCMTPVQADEHQISTNSAELNKLLVTQFAEPLMPTAATGTEENDALLSAIRLYQHKSGDDDFKALTDFIAHFPESGWRVALETNLGLSYYQAGRFSQAIEAWEDAWKRGKAVTEPHAKVLVDRALGELMRMHARIGHAERLAELFEEMGDRAISGPATEAVTGAREGLWTMENEPGIAYLCGPMALKNLLLSQGVSVKAVEFLNNYRSSRHGVSFSQVAQLAKQAKLPYELVKRDEGKPIPVPSIVHWKVSHYAAIIGENEGRYHIQDPIFGEDLWVTQAAIDHEASGYFLVPTHKLEPGWRKITVAEANKLYGMGYTGSTTPGNTKPQDDKTKPNNCNRGLCGYNFTELEVSLNLNDIPVGYAPPKGPTVFTAITYNQREASQPANFGFFNVSQKWSINWLSYIQDNPTVPGANVTRLVAGGGSVNYSGYNSGTGEFTRETRDQSLLVLTSANPIRYERRLSDGSIEVYSQSNGAAVAPRRVFLTQLIDSDSNAATLNYDDQLRLTSITDATGRNTTFNYESASNPLLITKITDPFGRNAQLGYDSNGRLITITDVLGLQSSFHYNSASLIDSLTTPYGTTTFAFGESGDYRWLEATDPLGFKERVEYRQQAPGIPFSDPAATVPKGIVAPFNQYLNGRDTFYWDKYAYQLGAGNYTKARNKHWVHWAQNTGVTTTPVESIKYPLENRIWFNYPGQPNGGLGTAVSGTFDKPIRIGRVLDDGSTQLTQLSYNSLGNPLHIIDPLGRDTQFEYDTNQIDLIRVSQKTDTNSYSTVAEFTYNSQHLPLTYKDAAGQSTQYAYNSAGQLIQVADALGHTTNYDYDNLGYLSQIRNTNGEVILSLTYDGFGRVASRTDSEGHKLAYSYDNFDRVTQVVFPDGTIQTANWDKLDVSSITDRQGRTIQYTYDAVRNLISTVDPLNRKIQYGYYPNQLIKTLTDANGAITTWNRDLQNRVTSKQFSDGSNFLLTYETTTSRLKSVTDALGQTKSFTYALDDRLIKKDYSNANNATPSVSFSYDKWFPRITQMSDGTGISTYQYQALGQLGALKLLQSDGPYQNDDITYQYDELGRLTSRKVDSSTESFIYDAIGRTVNHTTPLGSFLRSYLGETNQLTALQHTNGLVSTTRTYDSNVNDRRLLSILNSGTSRSFNFVTNTQNIIDEIHEVAPTGSAWPAKDWTLGYDSSYRLESAQSNDGKHYAYQYDSADNLLGITKPSSTTQFSVNEVNQLTSVNGQSVSYDANGNIIDDGIRTYQWDSENRLVKIGYKAQPTHSTEFRYDGLGRRVGIISKNGTISYESRYLWCGDDLCQSRTAADLVIRRYYPEGEFRPQGNTQLYYSRDHLGSIRDVLVVQNGARIASFDYDAFGGAVQTAGRLSTDFRYAGMFYLQEAGLYLTQYRVYDPETGRWLSRDPIGESGGINLYGYAGENPVNYIDPTGEVAIIDNIIGGLINVGIDYAIHKALGQCYSFGDFLLDFGLGFATDGLSALNDFRNASNVLKATTKAEILAANKAAGAAAEAQAAADLIAEGNTILGSQVSIRTSEGRRIVDHLIQTPEGEIVAVEVKSGNAVRNSAQLAKDESLATNGGTVIGKNAPDALRGQTLIIPTIERRY